MTPFISLGSSVLQTLDTLPVQRERKTVRGFSSKQSDIKCGMFGGNCELVCVYLCPCVFTNACANLMPTQCVRGQPQMAVGAGVHLIRHLLVSLPPAGPLTAPQRATCGMGGPSHSKVRSRVRLVAHFLTARGKW